MHTYMVPVIDRSVSYFFLHTQDNYLANFDIAEEGITFVRQLEDVDIEQLPADAVFECEVSLENVPAKWYKANKPLKAGDKYEMIVDGCVHRLIIHDINSNDETEYSIVARGKKSAAELFIEGWCL